LRCGTSLIIAFIAAENRMSSTVHESTPDPFGCRYRLHCLRVGRRLRIRFAGRWFARVRVMDVGLCRRVLKSVQTSTENDSRNSFQIRRRSSQKPSRKPDPERTRPRNERAAALLLKRPSRLPRKGFALR
jgi:hypothetical protein